MMNAANNPPPFDQAPVKSSLIERLLARLIPVHNDVDEQGMDWGREADRLILEQNPLRARTLVYSLGIVILVMVIWAAFAEIDEVTRGSGKVIPSQQIQIIQSLDGGVVTEILVKEGDIVEAGQLLVRLDATRFQSSFQENQVEYLALQAKAARLQAVAEGNEFKLNDELKNNIPDIVAQETILYQSSIAELGANRSIVDEQLIQRQQELREVTALRDQSAKSFRLAQRELNLTQPLVESGAVSEVELLRLQRDVTRFRGERDQAEAQINRITATIAEAKSKIQQVELDFKNKVRENLTDVTARINALRQSSLGLSDRVKQTAVRSPVRGTVKRLYFNTIGGVILPGKEVIEVVPLDDTLLLEARIHPKDIAFLRPDQDAQVKFTAYDFVVYGGLDGKVEHIGADTVLDEEGNPYYTVRVRTDRSNLAEDKPIIPGMVAEVDVLTGKKTILAYLMKPILRAKQYALTER